MSGWLIGCIGLSVAVISLSVAVIGLSRKAKP